MIGAILAGLQVLVWLSPASKLKNVLLRRFGHAIGRDVAIGPIFVIGCDAVALGDGVGIAPFNVFRGLRRVELGPSVQVGSWNWVSAHPNYRAYSPNNGTLHVGTDAFITSRHYFDCSGSIIVGASSAVAGQRSTLQTHELDLVHDRESVGSISIGDHSFVSTGCILLRDSALPARSLLAAGSTLTRNDGSEQPAGLWAGSPARFVKPMPGAWFDRGCGRDQDR